MPAAKITTRPFFQMAHGTPADIGLGNLVHEHGRHHPALHTALLNRVLQCNGVDDRRQHTHVVRAHPVHFLGLFRDATEEVAAAYHDRNFDAQGVHIDNLAGNFGYFIGIQAKTAPACQCLS